MKTSGSAVRNDSAAISARLRIAPSPAWSASAPLIDGPPSQSYRAMSRDERAEPPGRNKASGRATTPSLSAPDITALPPAAIWRRQGFPSSRSSDARIVGGAAVTEDVSPGCRVSSCSYIASMLTPAIIRDLDLARYGLTMVPCDPALNMPMADGGLLRLWADPARTASEDQPLFRARRRRLLERRRGTEEARALSAAVLSGAPAQSRGERESIASLKSRALRGGSGRFQATTRRARPLPDRFARGVYGPAFRSAGNEAPLSRQ